MEKIKLNEQECNKIVEERNLLKHENALLYKKIDDLEKKNCSDLKKIIKKMEERLQKCDEKK